MNDKQTPAEILRRSVLAGICIGIGATVYLSCQNKYVGSFLFGIGLFLICTYGFNLFTGKIGYAIKNRKQQGVVFYILVWIGNLMGCALVSLPMRFAKPDLAVTAKTMVEAKLAQTLPQTIILGIMCGIMMYIAVHTNKTQESPLFKVLAVFLPVAVFILCGFEHSIADMCYMLFAVGSDASSILKALYYIVVVSLSNGVGAILLCTLNKENK